MKRPAFQFYPADWRKDSALQSCSVAAQGLWINLLCIAHECEPYGHLVVNGRPMNAAQIGRLVGLSAKECAALLSELADAGVTSTTEEGAIYSRRMVRDEDIRNRRANGGQAGAEHGAKGAEHGMKGGRPPKGRGVSEPPIKPPPSSSSSSSSSDEYQEPTVLVGKASPPRPPDCPTDDLIRLYHERLPMLPRVEVVNDSRRRALSARWREVVTDPEIRRAADPKSAALDWFGWYFEHASKSAFLTGRKSDWRADFDFLLTPSKFAKVVEGSYHKEHA